MDQQQYADFMRLLPLGFPEGLQEHISAQRPELNGKTPQEVKEIVAARVKVNQHIDAVLSSLSLPKAKNIKIDPYTRLEKIRLEQVGLSSTATQQSSNTPPAPPIGASSSSSVASNPALFTAPAPRHPPNVSATYSAPAVPRTLAELGRISASGPFTLPSLPARHTQLPSASSLSSSSAPRSSAPTLVPPPKPSSALAYPDPSRLSAPVEPVESGSSPSAVHGRATGKSIAPTKTKESVAVVGAGLRCYRCGSDSHKTVGCTAVRQVCDKPILLERSKDGNKTVIKIGKGGGICQAWLYTGRCSKQACPSLDHFPCTLCGSDHHHPEGCRNGAWNEHPHPTPYVPLIPFPSKQSGPATRYLRLVPKTISKLSSNFAAVGLVSREIERVTNTGQTVKETVALLPHGPSRPILSARPNPSLLSNPSSLTKPHELHPRPGARPSPYPYGGPAHPLLPPTSFRSFIHRDNIFSNPGNVPIIGRLNGESGPIPPRFQAQILTMLLRPQPAISSAEFSRSQRDWDAKERVRSGKLMDVEDGDGRGGAKVTTADVAHTRTSIPHREQSPDGSPTVARVCILGNWPSAHHSAHALTASAFSTRLLTKAGIPSARLTNRPDVCFVNRLPLKFSASASSSGPRYLRANDDSPGEGISSRLDKAASKSFFELWKGVMRTGNRTMLALGAANSGLIDRLTAHYRAAGKDVVEWDWESCLPTYWEAAAPGAVQTLALAHVLQNFGGTRARLTDLNLDPFATFLSQATAAPTGSRPLLFVRFNFISVSPTEGSLIIRVPHPQNAAVKNNRDSHTKAAVLDLGLRFISDVIGLRFGDVVEDAEPNAWAAVSAYQATNAPGEVDTALFGGVKIWKGYEKIAARLTELNKLQNGLRHYLTAHLLPPRLQAALARVEECKKGDVGAVAWKYEPDDVVAKLGFFGSRMWRQWVQDEEEDEDMVG